MQVWCKLSVDTNTALHLSPVHASGNMLLPLGVVSACSMIQSSGHKGTALIADQSPNRIVPFIIIII